MEPETKWARGESPQHVWWFVSLVVVAFSGYGLYVMSQADPSATQPLSSSADSQQTTSAPITITNPDYLDNPSAYLVDYTDKVPSQIPPDRALWVEQILSPTSIRVSYTVEQSGSQIIKLKNLIVPGLGWPKFTQPESGARTTSLISMSVYPFINGDCWNQQAEDFLTRNLLHKVVYLVRTPNDPGAIMAGDTSVIWQMLIETGLDNETADFAAFMVRSGYGLVPKIPDTSNSYSDLPLQTASRVGDYGAIRESKLYSDQQVASLAKRGAWGVCGGT